VAADRDVVAAGVLGDAADREVVGADEVGDAAERGVAGADDFGGVWGAGGFAAGDGPCGALVGVGLRELEVAGAGVVAPGIFVTVAGTPVSEPGDASAPPWQAYQMYMVGELVSYNGRTYVCRQGHTSLPNWQPDVVPALWLVAVNSAAGDIQTWQSPVAYSIGDRVVYNGQNYRARQSHVSLPGWEPPNTPALWEPEQ